MKATIDVPDALYRRVKARAALEGRSVREVSIALFEVWLAEAQTGLGGVDDAERPAAAAAWSRRWNALGARIAESAVDGRSTREILVTDRRR
jgi:hypothetical protein